MSNIDPTARVDAAAKLGRNVEIGPYCIIGPHVVLGDECRLISHVCVSGHTRIGPRTVIYPFSSLGSPPQSVHYHGEPTELAIGADCDIRESVTISTGTRQRWVTKVGNHCFLMANSHIGHDCIVGDHVVFAQGAIAGGHCELGDYVFMGGLAALHQFTRVGESAIVGGLSGVRGDVIPFGLANGSYATLDGVNVVGMKRRGFNREAMHAVRTTSQMLFDGSLGTLEERIATVEARFPDSDPVQKITAFVRSAGARSLCWPRRTPLRGTE